MPTELISLTAIELFMSHQKSYDETVKEAVAKLDYPCYLICYGPERAYRTTYRSEHCGTFVCGIVNSAKEAFDMIVNGNYQGCLSEMDIRAISIQKDVGENIYQDEISLVETIV